MDYLNCVRPELLDVEMENVVPKYQMNLHILMGIVTKHHRLLKYELHTMDVMLANKYVIANDEKYWCRKTGNTTIDKHVHIEDKPTLHSSEREELNTLKDKRDHVIDSLT